MIESSPALRGGGGFNARDARRIQESLAGKGVDQNNMTKMTKTLKSLPWVQDTGLTDSSDGGRPLKVWCCDDAR